MKDGPPTRPSLLLRLRDAQDRTAWLEFVELYAPVVFGFARRRGFQDADVTQEGLRSVAGAIARFHYAPERGGFRAWLLRITKNHLRSSLRRTARQVELAPGVGGIELEEFADPDANVDAIREQEWRREIFRLACRQVRLHFSTSTWEAFHRTAIPGRTGREVAADLDLSLAAVYLAKSRVLARIRAFVETLEQE